MATKRKTQEAAPCFEVKVNGKRLALAGIQGEANMNAHLSWSRTTHYGEGMWARGGIRLFVGGGDFNDPVWDRFVGWVDRRLAIGDRVEIQVVHSPAPDRGRTSSRSRRIPLDEWPSRRNPTAVSVPGAKLYALTSTVLLLVGKKRFLGTAQLTPAQARKIGRGLLDAAEAVTKRQRRSQLSRRG